MPSLESTISSRIVLQSRAALSEADGVKSGPPEGLLSRKNDQPDAESLLHEELAEGDGETFRPSEVDTACESETETPEPPAFAWKSTDALSFEQLFGPPPGDEARPSIEPIEQARQAEAVELGSETPIEPVLAEELSVETAQASEAATPAADGPSPDGANDLWLEYVSPACPPPAPAEEPRKDTQETSSETHAAQTPQTETTLASPEKADEDPAERREIAGDVHPPQDDPAPAQTLDDEAARRMSLGADALLASRLAALLGKQQSLLDRMSAARSILGEKTDQARLLDPFAGPPQRNPSRSDFEALENEPVVGAPNRPRSPDAVDPAPAPAFIAAIAAAQKAPSEVRNPAHERPRPPVFSADAAQLRDMPFPSVVRSASIGHYGPAPDRASPSPWPGLAGGFALSLVFGGVLYLAFHLA